jgi:DNA-binding transcriptional ArsR family regulator
MQARICKALAHPSRMHIVDLIGKREHTVSELQKQLGIPLPTVSIQIAIALSGPRNQTSSSSRAFAGCAVKSATPRKSLFNRCFSF